MGKAIRRTWAGATVLAASLAISGAAMALPSDSYQDQPDPVAPQYSISNNLDNLFRVAGQDRISTAIALMNSSAKWNDTQTNDWVIVARSDVFPDALTAGPLADIHDAPILLTGPGGIDSRVLTAITAKGFKHAILVGGTGVFPASAMQQIETTSVGAGHVSQVGGVDRYQTAVKIAAAVGSQVSGDGITPYTVNVYLATGVNFPDALAAGAAASDNDGVVLLTQDNVLDQGTQGYTYKFLSDQAGWNDYGYWNKREIHTVGGQAQAAAQSAGIEDVADTNTGADRYETAVMLAGKFKHTIDSVAIVSGEGFADGIAAGGWVANHDGPLLLTNNAHLNATTKAFINSKGWNDVDGQVQVVVVGGTGSVSKTVTDELVQDFSF